MSLNTNALWQEQLPYIAAIRNRGIKPVFLNNPNLRQAFQPQQSLCCIDGGIAEGTHIAGSGVLLEFDELKNFVKKNGIKVLTSHDQCGAFAKAFPEYLDADRGSKIWGEDTAKELGIDHCHISIEEMDRPPHFHNEAVIYYDGTGMFNRIAKMPSGFTVSRMDSRTAPPSLDLAIQIALGEHGYGKRFSWRNPLHVVVIAHPKDLSASAKVLTEEVRGVIKNYPPGVITQSTFKTAWVLRDI